MAQLATYLRCDRALALWGSSKLRGEHCYPAVARRERLVHANRTRRRWLSRLRNPKATRAASSCQLFSAAGAPWGGEDDARRRGLRAAGPRRTLSRLVPVDTDPPVVPVSL